MSLDKRWLMAKEATPPQEVPAPGGTQAAMNWRFWTLYKWYRCLLYSVPEKYVNDTKRWTKERWSQGGEDNVKGEHL